MELRITGLEQVQRMLAELPKAMVTVAFGTALDQAGGVIAGHVAGRAARLNDASDTPLSEHVTVQVRVDVDNRGGIAIVGFDQSQDERTGIPQDLKAFLVEFGHRMIGHKPGLKELVGPNTPGGAVIARPFMRPALEDSWEGAVRVFAETLIDGLSGIAEKS